MAPHDEQHLMTRLESVYAADGSPGALTAVAAVLAAQLSPLGADVGFVAVISSDRRTVEVARVTPFSSAPVRLAFPIDAPYPLAAAIRRDEPLYVSSNDSLACDHPGLVRIRGEDHACATMPLHGLDGAVIGSANVSFEEPREFSGSDRAAISALITACEETLQREVARSA